MRVSKYSPQTLCGSTTATVAGLGAISGLSFRALIDRLGFCHAMFLGRLLEHCLHDSVIHRATYVHTEYAV